MKQYYDIIPIRDDERNGFDTIDHIADYMGCESEYILRSIGFSSFHDAVGYSVEMRKAHKNFRIDHVLELRLNDFLREHRVPIRVVRTVSIGRLPND